MCSQMKVTSARSSTNFLDGKRQITWFQSKATYQKPSFIIMRKVHLSTTTLFCRLKSCPELIRSFRHLIRYRPLLVRRRASSFKINIFQYLPGAGTEVGPSWATSWGLISRVCGQRKLMSVRFLTLYLKKEG